MVIKRGQSQEQETIMVGADKLEVVEEFRYLGCFEHKSGSMSCEMASRKNKMNAAYHGFKHVLLDNRLAIHTRLDMGAAADISQLESPQLRHLRALLSQARRTTAVAVLMIAILR